MPDFRYYRSYKQNRSLLLLTAVIFCLSVLPVSALNADISTSCSIEGSVKDTLGNLIPNVMVLLENNGQMAVTDGVGHFCFESAPEGPLTLLATYKGFAEKWVNDLQPGNGPVEIVLEPARIRESITVTAATRTEKRLEDVHLRSPRCRGQLGGENRIRVSRLMRSGQHQCQ